ncbi:MAG: hypothetical protein CMJ24_04045 [Phycisphaerae bacterium]|nr:hypothetical protein [Phycisphaerae bacterium]
METSAQAAWVMIPSSREGESMSSFHLNGHAAVFLLTGSALAGSDAWVIESGDVSVQSQTTVATAGTLVGDWDAELNPGGTQTIPGLFGGSGNNPIALSLDQVNAGGGSFAVTGDFGLNVDTELQLISVESMAIEMAAGSSIPFDSSVVMLYETFRSVSPDSLYIGGFEVPVPLASGQLDAWSFSQVGIANGALVETGVVDEWAFALPATLAIAASGVVGESPVALPPVLLPVLLTGTYIDSDDGGSIVIQFDDSVDETEVFDPPTSLPDVPLPLPTILPPGSAANVVLSMMSDSIAFQLGASVQISAAPDVLDVPGDATGDGMVGVDDLLALISQWGPCSGCSADFNGDDMVGVDDLLTILESWGL